MSLSHIYNLWSHMCSGLQFGGGVGYFKKQTKNMYRILYYPECGTVYYPIIIYINISAVKHMNVHMER